MEGDAYIVLCGQIVGGDGCGFELVYNFDGQRFDTRDRAIAHGFTLGRADDFNIGVLLDGALIALDWMDKPMDTHAPYLAEIAKQIGLAAP
jgi:hypothetical protein